MSQQADLDFYHANRADLVANFRDEFVLIRDRQLIGNYPTYAAALDAATSMFEPGSFLIKQVLDPEPEERI